MVTARDRKAVGTEPGLQVRSSLLVLLGWFAPQGLLPPLVEEFHQLRDAEGVDADPE